MEKYKDITFDPFQNMEKAGPKSMVDQKRNGMHIVTWLPPPYSDLDQKLYPHVRQNDNLLAFDGSFIVIFS